MESAVHLLFPNLPSLSESWFFTLISSPLATGAPVDSWAPGCLNKDHTPQTLLQLIVAKRQKQ